MSCASPTASKSSANPSINCCARSQPRTDWQSWVNNSHSILSASSILAELKPLGSDSYKRVLFNHGVSEPCLGVKIEELKRCSRRQEALSSRAEQHEANE